MSLRLCNDSANAPGAYKKHKDSMFDAQRLTDISADIMPAKWAEEL